MEIALYIGEDGIEKKGDVTYRKLNGEVCVGMTSRYIRQKWVEVVADLIRPERRGGAYPFVFAKAVQAVWKPEWLQTSIAMEHGEISPEDAWATMSDDLPDLGKDPRGEVDRIDTWMWSRLERKQFYICRVDLEDDSIAHKVHYMRDAVLCKGRLNVVNYRTDLSLSLADLEDIENPDTIVHPKLLTGDMLAANKVVLVCDPGDIVEDAP
jgi:hypothetical protein